MIFREELNANEFMVEWFDLYKKRIRQSKPSYRNGTLPHKSFYPKIMEFIINLAKDFRVENTVKYGCIELYDRFLSEYFIRLHENGFTNDSKIWQKVLIDCKNIAYLRVLSCMQLMSKYTLQCKSFRLVDVKSILKKTGYKYTIKQIISSEVEVFHTVNYKFNEPTLFMFVEFLMEIMPFNVTEKLLSTCLLVTDFVYINHQELFDTLQYQKFGYINNTYTEKLELLNIEYDKITKAAVVVLTAFHILDSTEIQNKQLCEYLSEVCEHSTDILFIISNTLIFMIN